MKHTFLIIISVICLISSINMTVFADTPAPPNVSADSAVLMDGTTGDILYGKNIDSAYPPASTTKIMTALLALENCKLTDVVTISDDFTNKNHALLDGNNISLQNGEQLTVQDLLYGMLLRSANDAAVALAVHISGSTDEFAKLMNKRAAELGCTTASFKNPNGLYDKDHKVSAKDLALILRELSKNPDYVKIATTTTYTMPATNKTNPIDTVKDRTLNNENKLIYKDRPEYYQGVEGGKTGYTTQSLFSYVACATRNEHRLIVTLVHSPDKNYFNEAKALFDYGFENYDLKKLYSKGDKVTEYSPSIGVTIPLLAAKDLYYVSKKDSNTVPKLNIDKKRLSSMNFKKGTVACTSTLVMDKKSTENLDLISGKSYIPEKLTATVNLSKYSRNILIGAGAAIIVLFLLTFINARRKKLYKKSF